MPNMVQDGFTRTSFSGESVDAALEDSYIQVFLLLTLRACTAWNRQLVVSDDAWNRQLAVFDDGAF